jgi:arylsulfatase A-like enzyme
LSRGSNFIPAERHKGVYEDRVIERAPNFGFSDADAKGKVVLKQALEIKQSAAIKKQFGSMLDGGISENSIRRRAEMMLGIDESTGRIVQALLASGNLENTVIIFTSDNGYFFGEHGLSIERRLPYEEALRAPLLIRYDQFEDKGTRIDGLVLSIDLAATILDLAKAPVSATVQGRSVLPLLKGDRDEIRDVGYMEYFSHENPMPWTVDLDYRVVRKGPYKYIHWLRFPDKPELYDLDSDPHESVNLIHEPALASVISGLREDLAKLSAEALGLGVN